MRTYTTIQGDLWDTIAYKLYGNENNMTELLHANPQYLGISIFSAGIILRIPEIKEEISVEKPPWMR